MSLDNWLVSQSHVIPVGRGALGASAPPLPYKLWKSAYLWIDGSKDSSTPQMFIICRLVEWCILDHILRFYRLICLVLSFLVSYQTAFTRNAVSDNLIFQTFLGEDTPGPPPPAPSPFVRSHLGCFNARPVKTPGYRYAVRAPQEKLEIGICVLSLINHVPHINYH